MEPRLLHTITLSFEPPLTDDREEQESKAPSKRRYAILSHRWAKNSNHEVSFDDVISGRSREKPGFSKVKDTAKKARQEGFDWVWIDTCCIDKRSSAELTEAINSMFRWYRDADCCYVYLSDIDSESDGSICDSEWFTRGWTLQELLAPRILKFFDSDWNSLGEKYHRGKEISKHTGIHYDALRGGDLKGYSVAQKMSWAAKRETTRPEDIAYCLLGIFDVNLVPIYGEGEKAFIRLQEEIIRQDDDHSIFSWSMSSLESNLSGLLAPNPYCFRDCSTSTAFTPSEGHSPFSITNRGLSIELEITPWQIDTYLAFIHCYRADTDALADDGNRYRTGIFLRRLRHDDQYARINLSSNHGLILCDAHTLFDPEIDIHSRLTMMKSRLMIPNVTDTPPFVHVSALGTGGIIFKYHDVTKTTVSVPFEASKVCQLTTFDFGSDDRFRQIAVGFDFGFNPVCVLVDQDAPQPLSSTPVIAEDAEIVGQDYDEDKEGGIVCRREDHDGLWRLKASRIRGMDVYLSEPNGEVQTAVIIETSDRDPLIWEIEVDSMDWLDTTYEVRPLPTSRDRR